ncbi:hypothetical protein ACWCQS_05485 [Streptomyces sp. NPDC002076]
MRAKIRGSGRTEQSLLSSQAQRLRMSRPPTWNILAAVGGSDGFRHLGWLVGEKHVDVLTVLSRGGRWALAQTACGC